MLRLDYNIAMTKAFGWRGHKFQQNDTNDNSRSKGRALKLSLCVEPLFWAHLSAQSQHCIR